MIRKMSLLVVSLFITVGSVIPQSSAGFALELTPGFNIPLAGDADLYNFGGGGGLTAGLRLGPFAAGITGGYKFIPTAVPEGADPLNASLIYGGGQLGFAITPTDWLEILLYGQGGYFYSFINQRLGDPEFTELYSGHNPFAGGGLGLAFKLAPAFSIGVRGEYRYFFGLYNDISVALGATLYVGGGKKASPPDSGETRPRPMDADTGPADGGRLLGIRDIKFQPIFPVFYRYYDGNPVGTVTIENTAKNEIENLSVSFHVKQYMDNPKKVPVTSALAPGEAIETDIFGLFTNEVLTISEGTTVSANIVLEFESDGKAYRVEEIASVPIENAQAMTWDDDRKAAAFVTAKESAILTFAKNVAGIVEENRAFGRHLMLGIAMHSAISEYGMKYVIDPTTPYADLSENETTIDFLQFPKQTLQYRAGDCDDLSILYCALLEAVGVPAAFVTVPGHIYIAFQLDMSDDQAMSTFQRADELILRDGTAWLPLEVTSIGDGFLEAWQLGAKEWRENVGRDQAGFYPIRAAWELYAPTGTPEQVMVTPPDLAAVENAYKKEAESLINREIYGQVARLQAELESSQGSYRVRNKLGVLYARYGLTEKSKIEFEKVLSERDYVPAMLNVGNLYFLEGDALSALKYYEQAEALRPDHPTILLAVAKAHHELENYGSAKRAYDGLKIADPSLADRFAYLDFRGEEMARAADVEVMKDTVLWEEDWEDEE